MGVWEVWKYKYTHYIYAYLYELRKKFFIHINLKYAPTLPHYLKNGLNSNKNVWEFISHISPQLLQLERNDKMIELRNYQKECIDVIQKQSPGAYLLQMATGMGKTVTFASIPRKGRELIISHREELVNQPKNTLIVVLESNKAKTTVTEKKLLVRQFKHYQED